MYNSNRCGVLFAKCIWKYIFTKNTLERALVCLSGKERKPCDPSGNKEELKTCLLGDASLQLITLYGRSMV